MSAAPPALDMIRVQGLHHTGLFVRELGRSRAFYEHTLGMACFLEVEGQAFLRFGRGDELALFEDAKQAPGDGAKKLEDPHGKAHVAFRIGAADYEAAKMELRHSGRDATIVDWGAHECLYFLDPDGHLLELVGPER